MRPIPRQPVPELKIDTVAHGYWKLSEQKPERFTIILFYRGHH